jgi:hypothetical protein
VNPATNEIIYRDWQSIWFTFAGYALVLAITFPLIFKYKHDENAMKKAYAEKLLVTEK